MTKIVERDKCNGCECCKDICPQNAISMQRDVEGFYYPIISEEQCVNCGLCGKVCPASKSEPIRKINFNDTMAYACSLKDESVIMKSSSGGFCAALAEYVLRQKGLVFGVAFSEDFRQVYFSSTDEISFDEMKGSKYVTAQKNGVYQKLKKALSEARTVLFVGLPCEVAAVYSFLGKDYENLITCELICAGASSYNLLDEQLDWIEKNKGGKIKQFSFRYKKYGWVPYSICSITDKAKYSRVFDECIFGVGMKYAKRLACFNCVFKGEKRVADFTAGDFWNIDKKACYYNEKGTSVVFCRTKKAVDIIDRLPEIDIIKVNAEAAINGNRQQLNYPEGVPEKRSEFFHTLISVGGVEAYKRFKPYQSLKTKIKNHLPAGMYMFMRRLETRIKL